MISTFSLFVALLIVLPSPPVEGRKWMMKEIWKDVKDIKTAVSPTFEVKNDLGEVINVEITLRANACARRLDDNQRLRFYDILVGQSAVSYKDPNPGCLGNV